MPRVETEPVLAFSTRGNCACDDRSNEMSHRGSCGTDDGRINNVDVAVFVLDALDVHDDLPARRDVVAIMEEGLWQLSEVLRPVEDKLLHLLEGEECQRQGLAGAAHLGGCAAHDVAADGDADSQADHGGAPLTTALMFRLQARGVLVKSVSIGSRDDSIVHRDLDVLDRPVVRIGSGRQQAPIFFETALAVRDPNPGPVEVVRPVEALPILRLQRTSAAAGGGRRSLTPRHRLVALARLEVRDRHVVADTERAQHRARRVHSWRVTDAQGECKSRLR
mmetsp:Transcript_74574/g.242150  ORF Transcript_74574/g.242150 Transcript_74574/m.242150 type:complete len:278 (+) Transcript_74574:256-1089(+)